MQEMTQEVFVRIVDYRLGFFCVLSDNSKQHKGDPKHLELLVR